MARVHKGIPPKGDSLPKDKLPAEIAARLAEAARDLRLEVYGRKAFPEWGTKFREIEESGMQIGLELARVFMEQTVQEQSREVPDQHLKVDDDTAIKDGRTKDTVVETAAGDVLWEQPKTRLEDARRDFFPSGQGAGD